MNSAVRKPHWNFLGLTIYVRSCLNQDDRSELHWSEHNSAWSELNLNEVSWSFWISFKHGVALIFMLENCWSWLSMTKYQKSVMANRDFRKAMNFHDQHFFRGNLLCQISHAMNHGEWVTNVSREWPFGSEKGGGAFKGSVCYWGGANLVWSAYLLTVNLFSVVCLKSSLYSCFICLWMFKNKAFVLY